MLENGKISALQLIILASLFSIGTTILIVPSGLAGEAKQDAWIASLVGLGIGILFVLLQISLGKFYPNMNLFEINERILGKWLGKIVSLLYISFFFTLCFIQLRQVGDFLTTQIMPETPIQAIHILFMSIVIMGVRLGLEVITRAAEILFPWVVMLLLFILVMNIPQMEFTKLQPVFEADIKTLLRANIVHIGSLYLQVIVFLVLFPYLNEPKHYGRSILIGTLFGGFVTVVITFQLISVVGVDFTARNIYPTYSLAKRINIGDFLQRIEALVAGIWFITIFIRLTLMFYASVKGLAQTLNLKDHKILTFPLGMITVVFSIVISPNITFLQTFVSTSGLPWTLTFGFLFPMILLVVAILRKRHGDSP